MARRRVDEAGRQLGWRGTVALVLGIAAVVTLLMTPWMGRGLALLLPSAWAQVAAGVLLTAGVVGCFVAGVRRPPNKRFPPTLAAVCAGLTATIWLLAPIGGRGSGAAAPAAGESVAPLILTSYLSWPVIAVTLGVLSWWDNRRRRRRGEDPDGISRSHRTPSRRSWLIGAGIPTGVAVVAVTLGLVAGPPASETRPGIAAEDAGPLRVVDVPSLSGTSLSPRMGAVERPVDEVHSFLGVMLDDLTRAAPMSRWWTVLAQVEEAPGEYDPLVRLSVVDLAPGADQAAVAATVPTSTGGRAGGDWWLVADEAEAWETAAVADGGTLLVLHVGEGSSGGARQQTLETLTTELTAERRAALAEATRAAG
ncbi:hypothetical protein [Blastococcus sp. TF02A-35]|uniref:hypothetical protein n=1 Tax=Blastococcus sp. TF02A-35 TaxID=2559612 RepID=UPI0010732A2B|nr:hypothetical protein [Blastococcus sp. TF02A_35]TFV52853.1 hypothetical protein E4P43_04445 [Blastococcus sp. TF02A_35]